MSVGSLSIKSLVNDQLSDYELDDQVRDKSYHLDFFTNLDHNCIDFKGAYNKKTDGSLKKMASKAIVVLTKGVIITGLALLKVLLALTLIVPIALKFISMYQNRNNSILSHCKEYYQSEEGLSSAFDQMSSQTDEGLSEDSEDYEDMESAFNQISSQTEKCYQTEEYYQSEEGLSEDSEIYEEMESAFDQISSQTEGFL